MNKETHMIRQLTLEETRTYIRDDSVRPHLSAEFRTQENREVWGLFEDQLNSEHTPSDVPLAVTCVAYAHGWPENESELDRFSLTTGVATIDPPYSDPEKFHANGHDTIEAAVEYAQEIQGAIEQCSNGTLVNSLGEPMQFDNQGNLCPCARTFPLQLEQNTLVFYTVWSYSRGSGSKLINQLAQQVADTREDIWHWVTLSPLTEMAEKFHIKNGAVKHAEFALDQIFSYALVFLTQAGIEERMVKIREQEEAARSEQARSA
jgi:hypothetical protein